MNHLVMVSIPMFTAIPRDVVTNTFHFDFDGGGEPITSDYNAMLSLMENFYEDVWDPTGTGTVASYMRPSLTRIKIYNLEDPEPRVPRVDVVRPLTLKTDAASISLLPTETAMCVSFKATPTPGIPLASQRGRIYLGGLGNECATAAGTSLFPAVNATWRAQVAAGASLLLTQSATVNWNWNILSKKVGLAFPVASGFIDNAWDTQRRRSVPATTRLVW